MGRHILMICTSGTSATALPSVQSLAPEPSDEEILAAVFADPPQRKDYDKRLEAIKIMKAPYENQNIMTSPDFSSSHKFPSAEMQTVLRWLSDVIQKKVAEVDELRIIILPSQDSNSILTAKVTAVCLQHLQPLFPKIKLVCSRENIIPLPIEIDTREKFLSSISNLFSELDELIAKKSPDEEVILCSTGGFKAVAGFSMMYAQLHSIPCLYSFEGDSSKAYEVMSIPLGYAYSSLDEEINMLKALSMNTQVDKSSLPQWVKDSENLSGVLLKSYERAREKPYGTGEDLFQRLRKCRGGNEWADYLQELLVSKWSNLWLGDQIPETVEHSRRHSKRLMELAANLFRCAGDKIEAIGFTNDDPRPLALLIASIYLHDIGHTALSYPVIINKNDIDGANLFPLGLFPSAVRELHHLLTGEVLTSTPERYFADNNEKALLLEKFVPLIAAHHRGYTVLKRGEKAEEKKIIFNAGNLILGSEKFNETLRPLEDRAENLARDFNLPIEKLLKVTALLRVLDGCDVQADRVISRHYLSYRNQRSEDEARLIESELLSCIRQLPPELQQEVRKMSGNLSEEGIKDSCKMIYSKVFDSLKTLKEQYETWRDVQGYALSEFMSLSLANRLAFKREQHLHFQKHQCVSFVLPSMDTDKNIISIKIFPNTDLSAISEKTMDDIIKAINEEYEKVKNVLNDFPAFSAELAGVKR